MENRAVTSILGPPGAQFKGSFHKENEAQQVVGGVVFFIKSL